MRKGFRIFHLVYEVFQSVDIKVKPWLNIKRRDKCHLLTSPSFPYVLLTWGVWQVGLLLPDFRFPFSLLLTFYLNVFQEGIFPSTNWCRHQLFECLIVTNGCLSPVSMSYLFCMDGWSKFSLTVYLTCMFILYPELVPYKTVRLVFIRFLVRSTKNKDR